MDNKIFNDQITNVMRWNAVASKGSHNFSVNTMKLQTDVIHEEVKETIAAVAKSDVVETLDGGADVFVTLAYKYFLTNKTAVYNMIPSSLTETPTEKYMFELSVMGDLVCIADLNLNSNDKKDVEFSMSILFDILCKLEKVYGVDMMDVIEDVMDSNWSKFHKLTPDCTEEKFDNQCRLIESNRGYKNVHWLVSNVDGHDYIVYRDNFGAGKIMKPMDYTKANPGQFLNDPLKLAS